MTTKDIHPLAMPLAALFAMTCILGYYYFRVDPILQSLAPLSTWPVIAKVVHYTTPYLILCALSGIAIAVLSLRSTTGDVQYRYWTHPKVIRSTWILALILFVFLHWNSELVFSQIVNSLVH